MRSKLVGVVLSAAIIGACLSSYARAKDQFDFSRPTNGTMPVFTTGGDIPNTYSASCTVATTGLTVLAAAVNAGPDVSTQASGRPLRKRCFQNMGSVRVVIGSSSVEANDTWTLGSATETGISPEYCTANSGPYFCATITGATASTVNVIQEMSSQP